MKKQVKWAGVVFAAACLPLPASASVVVMTFESGVPIDTGIARESFQNFIYEGFRVSPLCHVDVVGGGRSGGTGFSLGYDSSGCLGGAFIRPDGTPGWDGPNRNYLGNGTAAQGQSMVYIDLNGMFFDLTSISLTPDAGIISSNGGRYVQSSVIGALDWTNVQFSGPRWTNLTWIALLGGGGGAPSTPVDNITFNIAATSVPEPASWMLAACGLLACTMARRRKNDFT